MEIVQGKESAIKLDDVSFHGLVLALDQTDKQLSCVLQVLILCAVICKFLLPRVSIYVGCIHNTQFVDLLSTMRIQLFETMLMPVPHN